MGERCRALLRCGGGIFIKIIIMFWNSFSMLQERVLVVFCGCMMEKELNPVVSNCLITEVLVSTYELVPVPVQP